MARRPEFMRYVDDFNGQIKALVTDLAEGNPGDAIVARARSRVMLAISANPCMVIDLVGPYLYQYQKEIYQSISSPEEVERFFLENTFDAELQGGINREQVDIVRLIIPKTKEQARRSSPEKKKAYFGMVVGMLDLYLEYLVEREKRA